MSDNIDDIIDELNRLDAEEANSEQPPLSTDLLAEFARIDAELAKEIAKIDASVHIPVPNLDSELLREFARIDAELDAISFKEKILKKRKAVIDPILQEQFASVGIKYANVIGRTIYSHSQIWAKKEDGVTDDDMIAALKAAGYGEIYVNEKVNHQSLSALIREWVDNDESLPKEFEGVIGYTEKTQMKSKKS